MQNLAANAGEQERRGFGEMSRGWAIGTAGWRKALAKTYSHRALNPGLEQTEIADLKEARWNEVLHQTLHQVGKSLVQLEEETQPDGWRMEVARRLRENSVPYAWISQRLHLGNVDALRARIYRYHKRHSSQRSPLYLER